LSSAMRSSLQRKESFFGNFMKEIIEVSDLFYHFAAPF
jgi:hypothetical protein